MRHAPVCQLAEVRRALRGKGAFPVPPKHAGVGEQRLEHGTPP